MRGVLSGLLRVATGGRIGILVRFDGRTERETRLTRLFRMKTTEEQRTVKAVVIARFEKNVAKATGETIEMIDQFLIGTHDQFIGGQHRLTFRTLRKRRPTTDGDFVFHLI